MDRERQDERKLLAAALGGDPAAAEALVRAHEAFLGRIARTYLPRREDATDCLQDFWAGYLFGAYTSYTEQWRGDCSLRSWLAMLMRQYAQRRKRSAERDRERQRSLEELGLTGWEAPTDPFEAEAAWRVSLERCLEGLGRQARRAVGLAAMGERLDTIATRLGMSPNSVGPMLSRSRRALAKCMDE
jgi:RNA polymerase sigma factor (sigma-70 family)